MDEQDKQWYMHVDDSINTGHDGSVTNTADDIISNTEGQNNSVTASSSSTGPPISATVQTDFAEFSTRGRQLGRMMSEQALDSNINAEEQGNIATASSSSTGPSITATVQSEFANFSTRGRQLGRMTSEQALEYYMNQHNAGPSHS